MPPELLGVFIMSALGFFFAVILAVSYVFLRVEEDPRLDAVEEMLPGTNCGACGSPGCRAFAESVVGGAAEVGNCTVSASENLVQIADFLGVDIGGGEKRIARLKCAGEEGLVGRLATYSGTPKCRAAVQVNQGGRACVWGCLGLGDCAAACGFGAIEMSARGLPVVEPDRCTACNDCVEVCPVDLFTLVPVSQKLFVQCNTPLVGEAASVRCRVACDGCGLCANDAPAGTVEMQNGLPVIHYGSKHALTAAAVRRCPTQAIQWVDGKQFTEDELGLLGRLKRA